MAIVVIQETPAATREIYDDVAAQAGVSADPPDGLIVHTAGLSGETFRIIEVWESREAYERFGMDRLGPAIRAVAEARGISAERPQPTVYETHGLVRA